MGGVLTAAGEFETKPCYKGKRPSRRMPGHIREFNRLKPHSSHDLVFKIWRNNKTEATFGVFCL